MIILILPASCIRWLVGWTLHCIMASRKAKMLGERCTLTPMTCITRFKQNVLMLRTIVVSVPRRHYFFPFSLVFLLLLFPSSSLLSFSDQSLEMYNVQFQHPSFGPPQQQQPQQQHQQQDTMGSPLTTSSLDSPPHPQHQKLQSMMSFNGNPPASPKPYPSSSSTSASSSRVYHPYNTPTPNFSQPAQQAQAAAAMAAAAAAAASGATPQPSLPSNTRNDMYYAAQTSAAPPDHPHWTVPTSATTTSSAATNDHSFSTKQQSDPSSIPTGYEDEAQQRQ